MPTILTAIWEFLRKPHQSVPAAIGLALLGWLSLSEVQCEFHSQPKVSAYDAAGQYLGEMEQPAPPREGSQ